MACVASASENKERYQGEVDRSLNVSRDLNSCGVLTTETAHDYLDHMYQSSEGHGMERRERYESEVIAMRDALKATPYGKKHAAVIDGAFDKLMEDVRNKLDTIEGNTLCEYNCDSGVWEQHKVRMGWRSQKDCLCTRAKHCVQLYAASSGSKARYVKEAVTSVLQKNELEMMCVGGRDKTVAALLDAHGKKSDVVALLKVAKQTPAERQQGSRNKHLSDNYSSVYALLAEVEQSRT
eukprot:GDKI01034928.1.p1 GENE.GDKI01034928.1~~GDKI01034928.1.p1  ORF type:complete len:237 (-),score=79.80 GDKI01034928.1:270-980(-)